MVFTEVQIWRGVVLTLEEAIDFVKEHDEKYVYDEEEDFPFNVSEEINDNINKWSYVGSTPGPKLEAIVLGPCCSEMKEILIGFQLRSYSRSKKGRPPYCGKPIDSEYKCGDLIVCDTCINKTVNGDYPVEKILNKVTKCETYCFMCNRDKCQKRHGDKLRVTIEKFMDPIIKETLDVIDIDESRIGNYYRLNDCLSCS